MLGEQGDDRWLSPTGKPGRKHRAKMARWLKGVEREINEEREERNASAKSDPLNSAKPLEPVTLLRGGGAGKPFWTTLEDLRLCGVIDELNELPKRVEGVELRMGLIDDKLALMAETIGKVAVLAKRAEKKATCACGRLGIHID